MYPLIQEKVKSEETSVRRFLLLVRMAMKNFNEMKEDVGSVTDEVLRSIERARELSSLSGGGLDDWREIVKGMSEHLEGQVLRMAVVGAIKSGKSTFVNALLGKDYLKRGAGVMTSIITRVRKSDRLEATLYLKGWDEVNDEIRQALILFPSFNGTSDAGLFDIRNEDHRTRLDRAIADLGSDQVLGKETLDSKIALLSAYVKGYEKVRDIVAPGSPVYRLDGEEQFARHREFSGDDAMAVYLRDLHLGIPVSGFLNDAIEIGDCQGVDSINPRHLAMIQEYLLRTNLIIYVISSRTGLRRADVGFLSLIQQMGFASSVLFVLNVDMQEHEGLQDLMRIRGRLKEELSIIVDDPRIFSFSSLYWLFAELDGELSRKDHSRYHLWKEDMDLVEFCEQQRHHFLALLERGISRGRTAFLLRNHVERLAGAAANLQEWSVFNEKVLSGDVEESREMMESVRTIREQLDGRKQAIRDSLEGRSAKVKRRLAEDVDRFLDGRYGELSVDVSDFVEHYSVDLRTIVREMPEGGFSALLYTLFHDFRGALEKYLVETMNPRLVSFIRGEEKKAEEMFRSTAGVYDVMVEEAYAQYVRILERIGIEASGKGTPAEVFFGGGFPEASRPPMPSFVSTLQFGADIRVESILKLGMYRGIRLLKKILKRPERDGGPDRDTLLALANALRRIKKETRTSLVSSINGYKENLKYQYFYTVVDAMAGEMLEAAMDRFRVFSTDMSHLEGLVESAQDEKDRTVAVLRELADQSRRLRDSIGLIEKSLAGYGESPPGDEVF